MDFDLATTLNLVSSVLCFAAFVIGAAKLFSRDVPVFFKICACAVGCYALGGAYDVVFAICTGEFSSDITLSMFGIFGCLVFMVSANLEGDKIDAPEEFDLHYKKTDLFALVAPLVLLIVLVSILGIASAKLTMGKIVFLVIAYLPVLPASYLALLYLIRLNSTMKIYRYSKLSNLFILLFCILSVVALYFMVNASWTAAAILSFACALALCALIYLCCYGAKKWQS